MLEVKSTNYVGMVPHMKKTANSRSVYARTLCLGIVAAASMTACGKSVPSPTLDARAFEQHYFRPNPPNWAKVTVTERHFLLSSQQMYRSNLASVYFHSFDECQANLRNYSAWQVQGDINRSGQTFVHALAVDQYTDNSPALGPELVTLQCVDLQLKRKHLTTTVVDDGENRHQSGAHHFRFDGHHCDRARSQAG
ncbi:hypothetical protein [Trinickia acidisoli]|uniref:hypothetical protein n=1 Tax=Trinickia acidisoli TaxID=2767482 RepID=UPI001A8C213E|nr:hypothetical protein [Trinickia acidisoli]